MPYMSPTLIVRASSTGGMDTHRPVDWWFTCHIDKQKTRARMGTVNAHVW